MFANLLSAIEALDAVVWLRRSVWGYAAVNGAHILGIAILVGSILNVDLRMTGLWRGQRWREALADTLPVARAGFALAVLTGLMLFSVRAAKYAENPAFLVKMGLLGLALLNVILFHRVLYRGGERTVAMRLCSAASMTFWITILGAGRAIGFV